MTEPIHRPVSQLRAGDLIAPDDTGTVYVVCAVSQPAGTSRRAELVDARTGETAGSVRLELHAGVLTVPGRSQWFGVRDQGSGTTTTVLAGADFDGSPGTCIQQTWAVEVDLLGRPGWEQVRRGPRQDAAASAA